MWIVFWNLVSRKCVTHRKKLYDFAEQRGSGITHLSRAQHRAILYMLCIVLKTLWTSKNKSYPTPRAARQVFWDIVHLLNQPRAARKSNYYTSLQCSKHNKRKVSLDVKRVLFRSRRANVLDHKKEDLRVLKQTKIRNLISLAFKVYKDEHYLTILFALRAAQESCCSLIIILLLI